MDDNAYLAKAVAQQDSFETLCKRCGICCGSSGNEPCAQLKCAQEGSYQCAAYDARLGKQTTVTGKAFTCVSIREVLRYGAPWGGCGYI